MSIVRISHDKSNPYVMLNKRALEDTELSWAAKGLWSYLMSRPDNWNVSVVHLVKTFQKTGKKGGGEKGTIKLLNELIEYGYCSRTQPKLPNGLFGRTEYTITEFKNKVPLPDVRVPVTLPTNNKVFLKKKEQQQEVVAVAVPFACLRKISDPTVTVKEKLRISNKYPEEKVITAVKVVTAKNFKPETTMLKSLNAALKHEFKESIPKPEDLEKNLRLNQEQLKGLEDLLDLKQMQLNKDSAFFKSGESIKYHLEHKEFVAQLEKIIAKYMRF